MQCCLLDIQKMHGSSKTGGVSIGGKTVTCILQEDKIGVEFQIMQHMLLFNHIYIIIYE